MPIGALAAPAMGGTATVNQKHCAINRGGQTAYTKRRKPVLHHPVQAIKSLDTTARIPEPRQTMFVNNDVLKIASFSALHTTDYVALRIDGFERPVERKQISIAIRCHGDIAHRDGPGAAPP